MDVITEGGMLKHLCEGCPANHSSPLSQGRSTGLWDGDKDILSLTPTTPGQTMKLAHKGFG